MGWRGETTSTNLCSPAFKTLRPPPQLRDSTPTSHVQARSSQAARSPVSQAFVRAEGHWRRSYTPFNELDSRWLVCRNPDARDDDDDDEVRSEIRKEALERPGTMRESRRTDLGGFAQQNEGGPMKQAQPEVLAGRK